MNEPNPRAQLAALRRALLNRGPDDYSARRRLTEVEAILAQLDRADGQRRSVCSP